MHKVNFIPASELGRRTSTGAIDNAYYNAQVPNPMRGSDPEQRRPQRRDHHPADAALHLPAVRAADHQ